MRVLLPSLYLCGVGSKMATTCWLWEPMPVLLLSLHLCGMGSMMATRGRRHRANFVLSEMQGHQSNFTVDARPSCKMTKLLPLLLNTVPTAGKVLKMPTEDNPEAEAGRTQV